MRAQRDRAGGRTSARPRIARDAWERGQPLAVHGWVYGIEDGLLKDLEVTVSDFGEAGEVYRAALAAVR